MPYTTKLPRFLIPGYVRTTTNYGENYQAYEACDPNVALTGNWDIGWLSGGSQNTNQKFNVDLERPVIINRVFIENQHANGTNTGVGIKDVILYGTNSAIAFADITYAAITGLTEIASFQVAAHPAVNSADPNPQYFTFTNTTAYRFYVLRIANNWGTNAVNAMGIRAIAFQMDDAVAQPVDPSTTHISHYPPVQDSNNVKATSSYTGRYPYHTTDPAKSLIGTESGNQWNSIGDSGSQKFNIDHGEAFIATRLYIENAHNNGTAVTDRGAKNILVYGTNSAAAFANVTYSDLTDLTLLGTFQIAQHVAVDVHDPQYFTIVGNATAYRYTVIRIADSWGGSYVGLRRIEIQSGPTPTPPEYLNVFLVQPYEISLDTLYAALEQVYGIADSLGVSCTQLYSMVMEIWIAQHYGDVPVINRSLIQPYRSAPVLNKSLDQRWADALQIERSLLQEWSMPGPLEASSEQRYGICAEVLNLTCEQLYSINERTTLFAGLIQPYALAGEAARLYQFDIKLYLNGRRIPYHSLEWQAVDSESAWSCDFAVKSQAVTLRCVDGAAITIVSPWDTWQLKVSGGWSEDKRHGSTLYRVRGYSRTRDLDQALPLLGDLPAGMASQLVAGLAAPFGISVDWRMADGYLAAGKVTANDQTPMAVIKDIVHDARGIVLSTMDGNLLIVAEEEIPIPDWPTVTPADTIIARLERISTSSQPDEQRGYNRFKVSDQLASGDGFRWDTVLIDARTKEARLFVVPFDPLRSFALTHSGGTSVSIEPFGLRSLQVPAEQVEFVAGSSKTRLPIYGNVSYTWKQANLGVVSHAEDGLLTAATPGESLLSISYRTQYYRWIVRDPHVEDVQIIFNEVPA